MKQRFFWRKARRLARYAGISEYRNRVTIVGVGRYGGLKVDQARRLKELERENTRLRRAVADLTLEKLVLKEATEGNWQAPSAANDVSSMSVRSLVSRSAGRAGIWDSRVRRNGVGGLSSMMRKL